MAIVVYKCDVCKRDIELEQNLKGLENIQRCTITHGCRGKLYQTKVLPDYVRGRLPDQVAGLDDWRQRSVLYNHEQTIERDNWLVNHNLGTFPSVSVFVNVPTNDDPDNQEEIIPTDTIIIDSDNLLLKFDLAVSGLAQLVARQSDPDLLRPFVGLNISTDVLQQLSLNGDISIATRISTTGEEAEVEVAVEYTTTANTTVPTTYTADSETNASDAPWRSDDENSVLKVKEGSPLTATETREIAQDEVMLLFATKPYDQVDTITTQYIDVYDAIVSDSNFAFIYDDGEFFADEDIIQDIYPPIRSIQT